MTGKTHQILGITAGAAYFIFISDPIYAPATAGAVLVASHLSALLPDIDHPAAKIWDMIPFGKTLSQIPDTFLQHRNLSHSILGFLIFGFLIYKLMGLFPDYWGINTSVLLMVSLIAYSSHLIADMFTVEGIPLLFPYEKMMGIPPRPFEGVRIMTGKWFENLVIFPILNITLIVIIVSKWQFLLKIIFK